MLFRSRALASPVIVCGGAGGEAPGIRRAEKRDVDVVLRMNRESASAGLGFSSWEGVTLDEQIVDRDVGAGIVFVYEPCPGEGAMASGFMKHDHPDGVEIANLCGAPKGVEQLLEAARRMAGELGYDRAHANCVRGGSEEAVALGQGWSDEHDLGDESGVELIYEKRI